jgi:hypothetical protein
VVSLKLFKTPLQTPCPSLQALRFIGGPGLPPAMHIAYTGPKLLNIDDGGVIPQP